MIPNDLGATRPVDAGVDHVAGQQGTVDHANPMNDQRWNRSLGIDDLGDATFVGDLPGVANLSTRLGIEWGLPQNDLAFLAGDHTSDNPATGNHPNNLSGGLDLII